MSAHRIYFHLTWSTLNRQPMIDGPTRGFLEAFFRRIAIRERATIVELAFLRTHVHLLVQSGPRFDLSRLVQLWKGGSSYAASRQPGNILGLRWNREYSVTSPRLLPMVLDYIRKQDRRHPAEAIPRSHPEGVGPTPRCALGAVPYQAHSLEWVRGRPQCGNPHGSCQISTRFPVNTGISSRFRVAS